MKPSCSVLCIGRLRKHYQQGDWGDHLSKGNAGWTPPTDSPRGLVARSRKDRANTWAWVFPSRLLDSASCI